MKTCHICGDSFDSEHSDYVCDPCRVDKIRKRIADNTSYPGHIDDLRFLMQQYDDERAAHNEHVTELCKAEAEIDLFRERLDRITAIVDVMEQHGDVDATTLTQLHRAFRWEPPKEVEQG